MAPRPKPCSLATQESAPLGQASVGTGFLNILEGPHSSALFHSFPLPPHAGLWSGRPWVVRGGEWARTQSPEEGSCTLYPCPQGCRNPGTAGPGGYSCPALIVPNQETLLEETLLLMVTMCLRPHKLPPWPCGQDRGREAAAGRGIIHRHHITL